MIQSRLKWFSLIFVFLTMLVSCSLDESKKYDNQIFKFIIEITGEKEPEGEFIFVSDSGCRGCSNMIAYDLANGELCEDITIIIVDIKKLGEAKLKFYSDETKVYYDSLDIKSNVKIVIPSGLNYFVSTKHDVIENRGVIF
ncbi:hypothetical protein Belba_0165 [Belliella baltica DSM 15883]|uniref:Lipoprotein n=1 Tax=Belliella baltica (strain DSM 15883 / CIP 108006 / LMG 21964 / BA134) TaxID=866536 RepID=I3Z0R8_BELBD|nr:hypothetical protein [Belliella baltica]AFL82836.1 hypothetical protein Belba_0165 [Belliella baltica DSM 15883]